MKSIIELVSVVVKFLTDLLSTKQTNDWSPDAQIRKINVEIARMEDEKRLWQNKRSAYIRELMPVPEQLQSKLDEIVRGISELERKRDALKTK